MNSVGIDLHRKRSHVAVLDEHGTELLSRRIVNDPQTFLELLAEIDGESRIALEATYGWEWLADLLQEAGYELHLAHPLRTKAIASARVKNDAVDAGTLAHLLRTGLLPEAYIAPRELRELRDLLRHRVALTRMRSALKNRAGSILAKQGIQRPFSDMFGPGGLRFLESLELADSPRSRLDSTLCLIADFTREIERTTREIDARAKADPYVEVLCQIRGVGRYIAMLVIAEVGDVTRFQTARQLCSWAGMTPTVRTSDMRTRLGHISRQGSPAGAGRSSRPPSTPPAAAVRCATRSSGSQSGAAARSPRSRSRAKSSRSASTACATERSVASRRGPAHARSERWRSLVTRRGAHVLHDPPVSGGSSELACCQWPLPAGLGD
jgi:transposase